MSSSSTTSLNSDSASDSEAELVAAGPLTNLRGAQQKRLTTARQATLLVHRNRVHTDPTCRKLQKDGAAAQARRVSFASLSGERHAELELCSRCATVDGCIPLEALRLQYVCLQPEHACAACGGVLFGGGETYAACRHTVCTACGASAGADAVCPVGGCGTAVDPSRPSAPLPAYDGKAIRSALRSCELVCRVCHQQISIFCDSKHRHRDAAFVPNHGHPSDTKSRGDLDNGALLRMLTELVMHDACILDGTSCVKCLCDVVQLPASRTIALLRFINGADPPLHRLTEDQLREYLQPENGK